jgi:predicted small lipoprotein YifL
MNGGDGPDRVVDMNKAVIALALVILAGCGQKGPLYIPQPEKPAPETSAKALAPASNSSSSASSTAAATPATGN